LALAAVVALTTAAPAWAAPTLSGPLAPAASGQLQCYAPDASNKTCVSLATYRIDAAGVIQNTAVVLFLEGTTVETTAPVVIEGDRVCGVIRPEDAAAAKVVATDGAPVGVDKVTLVRSELKLALQDRFGQKICTAYVQTDAGLEAQVWVDGERDAGLDQMVLWVSPQDGYRAAP
jgi:hypothetical protein